MYVIVSIGALNYFRVWVPLYTSIAFDKIFDYDNNKEVSSCMHNVFNYKNRIAIQRCSLASATKGRGKRFPFVALARLPKMYIQ